MVKVCPICKQRIHVSKAITRIKKLNPKLSIVQVKCPGCGNWLWFRDKK